LAKETKEFQAETQELLNLMINSIYTNKEIFIRELISNASDAIDKVHFQSLTNSELLGDDTNYQIFLIPDENSHTLTISDNGIGMSREEVVENIGTIAKSGTKMFLEQLKNAKDNGSVGEDLIGQFGVGFYSAFMVADKVTLLTKKAGENEATRWESTGDGSYTIEEAEKESRGTSVILTLKEEFYKEDSGLNLTDTSTIRSLVKQYADYVRYPIKMNFIVEETPKDEEGKTIENAEKVKKTELRTLNSMEPLWTKNKSELKDEDYNEFFKQQFHEWEKPMEIFHTKAEGNVTYTALFEIPAHAPFNLYHTNYEPGISLYSHHVFIMDKCKDLLPEYLGFIKGLVDSPDLSLNISRELLQQSAELKSIGKAIEKNILKTLERNLKNKREDYEKFWLEYGKALKIGIYNSMYTAGFDTIDKLKNLILFKSSKEGKFVSLKEYVDRMPESQKKIYYATAKDEATIEKLPQMELLRDKGIEVLYLLDNVDEFAVDAIREYEEKPFHSISQGDLDLGDAESKEVKKETAEIQKSNNSLLKDIKKVLGDKVENVKISSRLKSSAVCLVTDEGGPSLSMEQTFKQMENPIFKARCILEINPHHELFGKLKAIYTEGKDSENFKEYCDLLYTQALIMEGVLPENPVDFANKIAKLMAK